MSERLHTRVDAGAIVPGFLPRAAVAIIGAGAGFLLAPAPFSFIAAALAVAGALFPVMLGAWGCALVLALAQLGRAPDALDWRAYAALATVHLLPVLGALATVVEPSGALQLAALWRPLRRWLAIQVPAQVVLAVVLVASDVFGSGGPGDAATRWAGRHALIVAPVAGVVALVAVAAIVAFVAAIVRRR